MKKLVIAVTILISAISASAQTSTVKDIFLTRDIVWYGLDFSKARFVGQFDQGFGIAPAKGTDMRDRWIPGWNNLIGQEPQNFELRKTFRKDHVYYDLSAVTEINSQIDADVCMSYNPTKISTAEIDEMVKRYNGSAKSGIGLVLIVENFSKSGLVAEVHVTFFDIATKQVLLTDKVTGKPMGNGMRNFWAGAIKNILHNIDGSYYRIWQKQYSK